MELNTLKKIGLTDGEAKVYITLLKVGNTSTGTLIKESVISRSKVYDVLERLKIKGLVTEMVKNGIRFFEATDPNKILTYLENKKEDINEKIIESKSLINDLNKLRSLHLEKQEAKVYVGYEGWKTVYSEILNDLNKDSEYIAFGLDKTDLNNIHTNNFIKQFHMKREEKNVPARIILQEDAKNEKSNYSNFKKFELKFSKEKFPTNIAIWNNSLLMLVSGENPLAFVINSKEVAEKYRKYFNYLWAK